MKNFSAIVCAICLSLSLSAQEEKIIDSSLLGYKLKYWVHVPKNITESMPVLYVTDGRGYKNNGLVGISEKLVGEGKIKPQIIVMVSAVNPDKPSQNRRNSQFLCNPKYVRFYVEELVPEIDKNHNTLSSAEDRTIMGLSFGGLNAMYFGLNAPETFGNIGVQSPAPHPCPTIYDEYKQQEKLPLKFFLTTGTVNDKAAESRKFKKILEGKGYEMKYLEVAEGHNWSNWKPLLDDALVYFYGI